jgi:type III pantothenate kinase
MYSDWHLSIDVGNTRIKAAWFDQQGAIQDRRVLTIENGWADWKEMIEKGFRSCFYAETRQLPDSWLKSLENTGATKLDSQKSLPFKLAYRTPDTLGSDRLAVVAGAWHLTPKQNCLVIDAGTCITYDIISKEGIYEGGCISPGLNMRLKAMHQFTNRLPLISSDNTYGIVGKDTETAIRWGAQTGFLSELDGFIRLFQNNFSALHIYITGGDGAYAHQHLKTETIFDSDLVLKGLFKISLCQ